MKHSGVLHSDLSGIIARLGHGQTIVIGDYGLPIPVEPQFIDLAVCRGVPSFMDVLEAILSELKVEGATIATELEKQNPEFALRVKEVLKCPVQTVNHESLKAETVHAIAFVRTGEHTSYANIILRAGVVF